MRTRAHTRTCMHIYKANSSKRFFLNCPPFCFMRHGLPLKVKFSSLATLVATKTTVDLPVAPPCLSTSNTVIPGFCLGYGDPKSGSGLALQDPSAEESPQYQVNDFYSNKI